MIFVYQFDYWCLLGSFRLPSFRVSALGCSPKQSRLGTWNSTAPPLEGLKVDLTITCQLFNKLSTKGSIKISEGQSSEGCTPSEGVGAPRSFLYDLFCVLFSSGCSSVSFITNEHREASLFLSSVGH